MMSIFCLFSLSLFSLLPHKPDMNIPQKALTSVSSARWGPLVSPLKMENGARECRKFLLNNIFSFSKFDTVFSSLERIGGGPNARVKIRNICIVYHPTIVLMMVKKESNGRSKNDLSGYISLKVFEALLFFFSETCSFTLAALTHILHIHLVEFRNFFIVQKKKVGKKLAKKAIHVELSIFPESNETPELSDQGSHSLQLEAPEHTAHA